MHEKIFIISCEFDFFCSECIFNQSNKDTCLDCSRYFNNLPIEKVSHLRKKPKKIKVLIHDRHIEKFGIFFSKSNSSIPCDQCRTYVDVIKKKLNILEDDCDTYQSSLRSTSSYNGYLSLYPQANNIYPDLEPQRTEYSYGPNGIIYDNSFPYNMAQNYNNPYNYQQGFVGPSFSNIPQQNFSNLSQNPQLAEYYSIVDNPYPYQHPHMAQGNIVINNGAGNYLNTQINNNIPQNIVNNSSQPLPIGSPTNYGGINIASQQYPFNNLTQQRDYSSQVPSMISNNVLRSGNLPQTNVLNNINKVEYNKKANANIPNLANNQILQVEPINPPLINYPLNKEENKVLYTQNFEEPHKCEKDTSSITSISVRRNPIIKCRSHKEVLLNLKCKHLICKKYIEQKLHNDFTKICRLANSLDTENLNLQNFSVDCPNEGCFSKYLYSIFEFQSQLDLIAREFQINRLLVEKILMLYEGYQKKFKLCQCRMIIFEDERCYCGR